MNDKPHYLGHRKRLRSRFMENGIESLANYEVIEILLTFSIPQRDVKPIAKELIARFGSLKGIFEASPDELMQVPYVKDKTVELIQFIREVSVLYTKQISQEVPVNFSDEDLVQYCVKKIGDKKDEEFWVICLDSRYKMVNDECVSEGTIDKAAVYPRKVMEIAIKNKAYALVFTHNHPNQNVEPSEHDITLTKALILAAKTLGITVYDHLIVSKNSCYSFRKQGLI